jgi:hypothetical protein
MVEILDDIHGDISRCVSSMLEAVKLPVSQLLHTPQQIGAVGFANLFMTLCIIIH